MWVYVHTSTHTQLYMHIYAIICNFMHTYTYLHTYLHICTYLYMYRGTLTWSRGHNIANICTHTLAHTHIHMHRTVRSPSVERLSGPWKCMKSMSSANSSVQGFFTHALCNQYCMSGLKHSRGARFSNPRVRSWLQRSIRSVWEFSKESLQPIECYCPTPPHP